LAEPLEGAVGLLEAVSFKEATESVCRGRTANARGEGIVSGVILVNHWGLSLRTGNVLF